MVTVRGQYRTQRRKNDANIKWSYNMSAEQQLTPSRLRAITKEQLIKLAIKLVKLAIKLDDEVRRKESIIVNVTADRDRLHRRLQQLRAATQDTAPTVHLEPPQEV